MAVELYIFDAKKRLRQAAAWGLSALKHDERDYMLTAKIRADYGVRPGEFLGFTCCDGRFRLFEIETEETEDAAGETTLTATEAAVSHLAHSIVKEIRLTQKTAREAAEAALKDSGFTLGTVEEGERKTDFSEYYQTRWKALREIESACHVRIVPYYTFEQGEITGAYVDILQKTYPDNGRIFTPQTDARDIWITRSGLPITRLYALGEATGTEDPPKRLTIENAVWSKEKGDPIDKPKGQDYIEDPDAVAEYGEGREAVFEDKNITDKNELIKAAWKEYERLRRPQVSGSARLYDMRIVPGYEHKAVEIYTLCHVMTAQGEILDAKIIDVQRDYIDETRTQVVFGEEDDGSDNRTTKKLSEQVARTANTARRLGRSASASANRYIETKQLIQLNADTIQLNAEELIELNSDVTRINGRLEAVYAEIDSIISGETTIRNLNVQNIRFSGSNLYKKTVDVDGTTHRLIAYGSGD